MARDSDQKITNQDLFIFLAAGAAIVLIAWTFLGNVAFLTASHTIEDVPVFQGYYLQEYRYFIYETNETISNSLLYVDEPFLGLTGDSFLLWAIQFYAGFVYIGLGVLLTLIIGTQMWYRFVGRKSFIPGQIWMFFVLQLVNLLVPLLMFFILYSSMPVTLNPGYVVIDLGAYLLHFVAILLLGFGIKFELQRTS
ncbi:MAG: hypothetical protein ACFFBD_00955 [Candidatus Hodarchaeota archaeon]